MSRYKRALDQAIREYNAAEDAGDGRTDAAQAVIIMALLYQNELLEELVGRTTPF